MEPVTVQTPEPIQQPSPAQSSPAQIPPANQPPPPPQGPQPVQDPYYDDEDGGTLIKKILLIAGAIVGLILIILVAIFLISKLSKPSKPKDVTLLYWGVWEDATVMQPILDDFHKTHPRITIKYEKQDIKGLGNYIQRLNQASTKSNGPDIIRFHSSWLPEVKNLLLPLPSSVVKNSGIDKDYYKTVSRDLKYKGAYYGIPLGIDTLALFVNTNRLNNIGEQIPTTWEDLAKVARKLMIIEGDKIVKSGLALGTYQNIAHAPDVISLLLRINGADITNLAGPQRKNTIEALQYYTSFAKGEDKFWDPTLDNSKLAFAKGDLAMYFGYSWDIFEIDARKAPDVVYQTVKIPSLSGRHDTIASYWAEGVSVKSKYSPEAFQFLEYLSKPDTLQKLYAEQSKVRPFGSLYPRRDMASLLKTNTLIAPFFEQGDDAQSSIFASDTYDDALNKEANKYLEDAINSVNQNNGSIDTAVDNSLAPGVAQVLTKYGK